MSSISFTAHGRCARATVCEPITTGSVGLSVSFAFDAAWGGLQKTAIFRGSGMAVDLVLSGDAATVPPEVLTIPGGDLRIGVWGADPDENVIIPTVWATVGEIVPGSAPSGIDPQPPTPSWVAQVQEIAQDALDTANSVREDADAGAFDGATYTPALSAGGDLSWTNDKSKPNPPTVNIKGPEGQPGQTGATPDISIGTVETLPPGSPATATMTGTAENPVLSFGIPQGQQGAPGEVTQAEFDALADDVAQNTENIADLDGELTLQKSAINNPVTGLNSKAPVIVNSASGELVHIMDGADSMPVKDLAIDGVESATVTRTGKNMLDSSILRETSAWTQTILNLPPGTYTMSTDMPVSVGIELPCYFRLTTQSAGSATKVYSGHPVTITIAGDDATAMVQCRRLSGTDTFDNYHFQIELGSNASAYETYQGDTFSYPSEIVTTIFGVNNIWSDAGAVDVSYCADTKLYIDRLNQPTEDDMIANSLIESGKYFTVNNRLFLSTASIAAGAQIIPDTNCTETSLAAALNARNS